MPCLLPFLLGWPAYAFYNVGGLKGQINDLTTQNGALNTKVTSAQWRTDLRVQLTQRDAEIERLNDMLRKSKSDLIMAESERNALREQLANAGGGASKVAKAAAVATFLFAGVKYKMDDLKIVEGIGPKIADLLIKKESQPGKRCPKLRRKLSQESCRPQARTSRFTIRGTWPHQARLADEGKWDELKALQMN